jgi:methylenetetrahydrofolate dehydrogenase (NADP+)/methenyltetrahydrofolate cyclohydrolase
MIIDGKQIANDIKRRLLTRTRAGEHRLSLGVIVVHQNFTMNSFVEIKRRFGEEINVRVDVLNVPPHSQTNEELLHLLLQSSRTHDGLLLQLPLPRQYMLDEVLHLFPLSHDVDVLGVTAYHQFEEGKLPFLPPVIGAFAEILQHYELVIAGKKVVVVGEGRLVGAPAAIWANHLGAVVQVANRETKDLGALTRDADVVILGAGSPGILKPDMVKNGVIVLDAGTSEVEGALRGDADPAVAEKASLFTPTPGGIGPITVAKVFENLLVLADLKQRQRG